MAQQHYPKSTIEFIRRNVVYVMGVVGVVAAAVVLFVVAGAVLTGCSVEQGAANSSEYKSPYDWTKVERNGDRLQYVVDGKVKSRAGVDVSENQHDIDWDAVAADGIDFAMVRLGYRGATEGNLYLDSGYWDNLDGARAAGLDCGVYFFSQARTVDEAVEEADYVLTYLNGTSLEYPIAFDSEVVVTSDGPPRTSSLNGSEMTAIAKAFCDRVQEAGYRAMVYGNGKDMARYADEDIAGYPVWWAEYDSSYPDHDLDITMWQYSNAGEVAGIPAAVDLNIDLSGVFS